MRDIQSQITFFPTTDLARTAAFYENVLALPLALDQGSCRIYSTNGNAFIGFCRRDEVRDPDGIFITLVTDDVDGWYEQIREQGVEFEKPPSHNAEYRIYHCLLRDPNGYLIEIQRFEDPRWTHEGRH